jgi:hypothetical protein
MAVDLNKYFEASTGLIDLEQRLADDGFRFKTVSEYLEFLESEWGEYRMPEIKKIFEAEHTGFPTLIVPIESREYHLHGIIHGSGPFFKISEKVQTEIKSILAGYHNLPQETFAYEQNLDEFIPAISGIEAHEIRDHDISSENNSRGVRQSTLTFHRRLSTLMSYPMRPIVAISDIYDRIKSRYYDIECIDSIMNHVECESRHNMDHQKKAYELQMVYEFPQPFEMETELLSEFRDIWEKIDSFAFSGKYIGSCGQRSKIMAESITSKFPEAKVIHLLSGMAHTSEVAYFLKNPDYSFQGILEYDKARK